MGTQREAMTRRSVSLLVTGNMLLVALVCSFMLVSTAERVADEWVDPNEMPGPSSKRMESEDPSVPPKRDCASHRYSMGGSEHHCDATEQQGKEGKKSVMMVNPDNGKGSHNPEVWWLWQLFEDYGVELDPTKKVGLLVLFVIVAKCREFYSKTFQFVRMRTLATAFFLTSIIWNWFYLYKEAFAKQKEMALSKGISEKCPNITNIGWTDGLTVWFWSTWMIENQVCQQDYYDLFSTSILQVSPVEAISGTVVMIITVPLIGIGQGIRGFLGVLLKDLPLEFQYSVFILVAVILVILAYARVQGAFQSKQEPVQLHPPSPTQGSPPASTGVVTTGAGPPSRGWWSFSWW